MIDGKRRPRSARGVTGHTGIAARNMRWRGIDLAGTGDAVMADDTGAGIDSTVIKLSRTPAGRAMTIVALLRRLDVIQILTLCRRIIVTPATRPLDLIMIHRHLWRKCQGTVT